MRLRVRASRRIDGTFADLYQMALASDTTIDLRLNSSAFDAYLVVLDAKGNVVAADDNDGGGTNSPTWAPTRSRWRNRRRNRGAEPANPENPAPKIASAT
jgi:hypothetical protein